MTAQEKPVPKDSTRIFINGCAKGQMFTAGPVMEDQPGRSDIKPGTRFRLNGPKNVINEIKAHKGTMIEVTGLIKKGQYAPGGIALGGHVSVGAATPMNNNPTRSANATTDDHRRRGLASARRQLSGLIIYKIVPAALWRESEAAGRFSGSPVDLRDGFIHFSTASQVPDTAAKHFAGVPISCSSRWKSDDARGPDLRWEPSRGGELFPISTPTCRSPPFSGRSRCRSACWPRLSRTRN